MARSVFVYSPFPPPGVRVRVTSVHGHRTTSWFSQPTDSLTTTLTSKSTGTAVSVEDTALLRALIFLPLSPLSSPLFLSCLYPSSPPLHSSALVVAGRAKEM